MVSRIAAAAQQPVAKSAPEGQVSLRLSAAFGAHCGTSLRDGVARLRDSVLFADARGRCLVQPVGRHLAFRHLETGATKFAQESTRVEVVTALAISEDRRLLCVCERCTCEPYTQLSVYDLAGAGSKPLQTLEELGDGVGWLICASFIGSGEENRLCVASDVPNPQLLVLDWRANHVLGRCSLPGPATHLSASLQSGYIAVSGSGLFGLWALAEAEEELEQVDDLFDNLSESYPGFVDHAWVVPSDGTLLLLTSGGSVLHLDTESGTVLAQITEPLAERRREDEDVQVDDEGDAAAAYQVGHELVVANRICCFPGGFALAGPGGIVSFWEAVASEHMDAEEDEEAAAKLDYRRNWLARVRTSDADICCLDVVGSDKEQRLVCGFSDAQIGHVLVKDLQQLSSGESADSQKQCTILCGGFHSAAVSDVSIATHRPLIVSLSRSDCTLRIWNYIASRCELVHELTNEEPTGVALHPLGFLVAVTFADKLRLFQILASELLLYKEMQMRGARVPCFSNGGHMLAVIAGKQVTVFNTYTFAKVAMLRGHSSQVASMSFDSDDGVLATVGEDGSIAEWSTRTWTKRNDAPGQSAEAFAVAAGGRGRAWCSVVEGPRNYLRSYKDCGRLEQEDFEVPDGSRSAAVCLYTGPPGPKDPRGATVASFPALFIGAASGSVWVCRDPTKKISFEEYAMHVGACSRLCLSGDGCTVVSAGEDGAIFVFDVVPGSAPAGKAPASGTKNAIVEKSSSAVENRQAGGEILMINRGELLAGLEEFSKQSEKNAALHAQLAEEAEKIHAKCRDDIEQAHQTDREEIRKLRLRYGSLQQTATTKERENIRAMKAMEASHLHATDQLEQSYDRRIRAEADRHVKLSSEMSKLDFTYQSTSEEIERQRELQHQRQHLELTKRLEEKDVEIAKLKDLVAFTQHRFDTMLDQEGMEHDLAIAELHRECQAELEQQKVLEYKLKKEQDTIIRSLENLEKERQLSLKERDDMQIQKTVITKQNEELTQQMTTLKDERREREKVLREKELEIGTFKGKVNTLSKFKHVLDFRLREVQLSLQPKDRMISKLNEQLRELEKDFENLLGEQRVTEAALAAKSEDVSRLVSDNARLQESITKRERQIGVFTEDLNKLVDEEQDVRFWPRGLVKIYKKHVPQDKSSEHDDDLATQEIQRQIGALEGKVTTLSSVDKRTEALCRANIRQKTQENSLLIQEVNELRVEQKNLQREAKDLELRVKQAEYKLNAEREARDAAKILSASPSLENLGATAGYGATVPYGASTVGRGGTAANTRWGPVPQAQTAASIMAQVRSSGSKGASKRKMLEEQKQMQKILLEADKVQRMMEVGALENKILRDQVEQLMQQRRSEE